MAIKHGYVPLCDGCNYDFDEGDDDFVCATEQAAKDRVLELGGAVGDQGEVLCSDCAEDLPDEEPSEVGGEA